MPSFFAFSNFASTKAIKRTAGVCFSAIDRSEPNVLHVDEISLLYYQLIRCAIQLSNYGLKMSRDNISYKKEEEEKSTYYTLQSSAPVVNHPAHNCLASQQAVPLLHHIGYLFRRTAVITSNRSTNYRSHLPVV